VSSLPTNRFGHGARNSGRTSQSAFGRGAENWTTRGHLDEVYLKIGGHLQYLWRAVDQDGSVLDILVQPSRDRNAAARFFKRLLRRMRYKPRVVVTDKRVSYTEPCAELLPNAVHRRDKGLNNRADARLVQRLLAQRR
jgi:putative transposase